PGSASEDLKHYPVQEYYPITENQRGVYLDWEMHRESTQYNTPSVHPLPFDTDLDYVASKLKEVIDAHSYVKTRFCQRDEDVMQQPHVSEPAEVSLTFLDFEPDEAYFQSLVRPFDIFNERLYRIELFGTPSRKYVFFDFHHLIFDGLSMNVLLTDLGTLMSGGVIEAERVSAYDFALYEKELSQGAAYAKAEERFDSLLNRMGLQAYPDSLTLDEEGESRQSLCIPSSEIDTYCSRTGVTVSSFMHAAFSETLRRLTRDDHPTYVTVSNGRSASSELLRCMGMFVKTIPVVGGLEEDSVTTVDGMVRGMHTQLQDSFAMDFYPYTRMVERHGIHSEILFIYQGGLMEGSGDNSGKDTESFNLNLDTNKFALEITAAPADGAYVLTAEYDCHRYNSRDIGILLNTIGTIASGMTEKVILSEVQNVDDESQCELMALGKGEELAYDHSETLVDLIRRQAKATPDATAVVYEEKRLSYRELDELTDRLASLLISRYAVRKEEAVGVMIERSELMAIYPLAIMKAGGAYMPLDFKFPAERLEYMCQDAGVRLILSEGNRVQEAMPDYDGETYLWSGCESFPTVTSP
ncbi:MAG: condensation domain-containing protein, partial [Oscillospiraceae bacterium]|nr:condensation domain-containing protein [Oscillospiraceae bacterium]